MWRNIVDTYTNSFWRDRRGRTTLGFVLLFLAVVVAVLVYWQLRLSGIAMTNETYCGYEEHTHTEECYESVLICGLEEIEGHTHSEDCYEQTLICELEEHTHTVDCLVDLEADVEDATVWEATLPELTYDLRTDIVNIAYSQIGYTESIANYTLAEDGITHMGYTRYGAWYGGLYYGSEYSDWDSMFVAFCLDYAGVAEEFTYNSGAFAWSVELATLGYYQSADAYTPEVGDVAFIDTDLDGRADVTAIVVSVGDTITVIQGNVSDTVALVEYPIGDSIIGYANVTYTVEETEDEEITLDESDEIIAEEIEELDVSAEDFATLEFVGEDYIITVSYGEDAALPEGTELVAYEYAQDSENFLARYEEAAELYGWEGSDETDPYHGFRLFNIGLYYDGTEIEPAAAVTVTVTYTGEDVDMDSVYVTHFTDTSTEPLPATVETTEDTQSVTFTSDSFSEFGITLMAEANSSLTVTYGGTSYTVSEVRSFNLTIYDNSITVVDTETEITDVLSFTADSTYYLIPVSYFKNALSEYSFDESSTTTCPFMYAPYSNQLMETMSGSNYQYADDCYYAYYTQVGDDWYVQVTDATAGATPRANVYYCPTFEYYFYLDSVADSTKTGYDSGYVSSGTITDFVGYKNYTLIPITYFSDHIVELSLGTSTAGESITINGVECAVYEADDFKYKTLRYNTQTAQAYYVDYNGTWYMMVQDLSVGYALPRVGIISYTGNVGVYTAEDEFYLWIYDSDLTKVAGYSEYDSNSGTNFRKTGITDALSYTDSDDGETYYYIPITYFTSALASDGYEFDSNDTTNCPLIYAPDATKSLGDGAANILTCSFATYEKINGTWYVRVQDTYGQNPHRANVYYCPEYVYNIYVADSASYTGVEEVTIDDYIGFGERYVLIPVSHFDNFFDETTLTFSSLTEVTDDFTGYNLSLYKSPFMYSDDWSNTYEEAYYAYYNGSWYLLVQHNATSYSIPLRNKIWYTGSITEGVVLNLTNGNGTNEFTHYGDYCLRYTVNLTDFADNGSATITLPSDSDLGTTFAVASNGSDSANVELSRESAYDYKLVGWYNIATGEYYDVSNGPVSVTVDLSKSNVFYADWIANDYDFVENTGASNIITTADTSSFVTIQLFDFNELFNLYSESLSQDGLTSETWTDSGEFYSEPLLTNTALSAIGNSFIFFDTSAPNSTEGRLSLPAGRKAWSYWTGNSAYQNEAWYNTAYTGLYDTDILNMLYSTDGSTLGSYYVGEANYLFTYDDTTGFYSYDSGSNAAVYQQSDERFYVYNSAQTYDSSDSNTIFLPFNSYSSSNSTYTSSNGEINYWFGVKIDLTFYLPNSTGYQTGTGTYGNQINGENMVFDFEGDDDVWVFVDDKLVLDLGGIHSAIEGEINFSTGQVIITDAKGDVTTKDISDILSDLGVSASSISAGTHTLTFYYMERGAGASNMKLTLNTIPEWQYETSTVGTMKVEKTWVDNDNSENTRPTSIVVGLFEQADSYSNYLASIQNSLVYVYNNETYYIDDDGYSYNDTDGYVDAYISNGYIYVRVDTQTLTDDGNGNWTYTWTLLDSSKSEHYQIRELSTLDYYSTSYSHETLTYYETYWSIEGDETLNGDVTIDPSLKWTGTLKDGLEIVITDGAQGGIVYSYNFPTTYTGYVLYVNDKDEIGTTVVEFSQAATQVGTSSTYTYGVTENVPTSAIWTVEMTGEYASFTKDNVTTYVPTFYLKSSTGEYLAIVEDKSVTSGYSLELVTDKAKATAFCYDTLGELNTEEDPGLRIVIEDGSYALVSGRQGTIDTTNVKVYTPTTSTIGSTYTITNTILPTITLKKIETVNETTLSDVVFEMYQKDDDNKITYYYSFDNTKNKIDWSGNEVKLTTDSNGTITYKYIPDGTYYLTETKTVDGYNLLTEELWFTVSGGKVTAVSNSDYISVSTDGLTIIVKNTPGAELPETGGISLPVAYAVGSLMIIISAAILILRRNKKSIHE